MITRRAGRKPKDLAISDNFNPKKRGGVTKKLEAAAKLEKKRIEAEQKRNERELRKIADDLERAKKLVGVDDSGLDEGDNDGAATDSDDDEKDLKSAEQMLAHLRYAYRNSIGPGGKKGRGRLVALMETDAEFKFAVKELLKIEASLLAAKIKKDGEKGNQGGVGQQNFFVILKGLEDVPGAIKRIGSGDNTVDMKQITRAMNPDENSYEPEEEVSQREAPEQLSKQENQENVEGW